MSYLQTDIEKSYITGDYDLFNVCPQYSDYGQKDIPLEKRLNCMGSSSISKPPFYRLSTSSPNFAKINQPNIPLLEDPDQGNVTERIKKIIHSLSLDFTRENSHINRVHHNTEAYNPYADELKNCFPISYFLPIQFCSLKDKEPYHPNQKKYTLFGTLYHEADLLKFRDFAFQNGYFFPVNKKWNLPSYFMTRKVSIEKTISNQFYVRRKSYEK